MAAQPSDYAWSSYRINALGKISELCIPHPLYNALGSNPKTRQSHYSKLFKCHVEGKLLEEIRIAAKKWGGLSLEKEGFRWKLSLICPSFLIYNITLIFGCAMAYFYNKFLQVFTDTDNTLTDVNAHHNLIRPLFLLLVFAACSALILLIVDVVIGLNAYEALRAWLHDSYGWEFTTKLPEKLPEKLGPFGDFFGGVLNPILTFLTFFGLILTIVIQRIELRLTREEYRKASKAMVTQAIETTFFNLIDLHHKIVDGLVFGTDMIIIEQTREQMLAGIPQAASATFTGRAVFGAILSCITKNEYYPSHVSAKYTKFHKEKNFVLGHYFRNLYQALKAIDPSSDCVLTTAQANKYASILRAQLSTTELAVLFLNCLDGVVDGGEFKNLLIKYRMLEHLPLKKGDNYWTSPGIQGNLADKSMIEQYLTIKAIIKVSAEPIQGAFGNNPAIKEFVKNANPVA